MTEAETVTEAETETEWSGLEAIGAEVSGYLHGRPLSYELIELQTAATEVTPITCM